MRVLGAESDFPRTTSPSASFKDPLTQKISNQNLRSAETGPGLQGPGSGKLSPFRLLPEYLTLSLPHLTTMEQSL